MWLAAELDISRSSEGLLSYPLRRIVGGQSSKPATRRPSPRSSRGVLSGMCAPAARAFETAFASFVGARYAAITTSGTAALQVALAAVGVGAGDEVIVPAYSFIATAFAVMHQGAFPVFADVDPLSGNIDPASIEAAMTERTKAIMPVHVHGNPCDLDAVLGIAERFGVPVVEDAAQAHGATYRGRPVGAMGACGGFSLQSSKNLSAGEGGVFVTNDPALFEAACSVRSFGQDIVPADGYDYDPSRPLDGHRTHVSRRVGSMLRGNELTAAVASAQLARLPELTAKCQQHADRLRRGLLELPGVLVPGPEADRTSVHHKFRVHFDPAAAGLSCAPEILRDAMIAGLRAEGLEVVLWQTMPLPAHPIFHGPEARAIPSSVRRSYDPDRFPATTKLLARSIVLFSQSCPLIAQETRVVDAYVEAFHKVWSDREAVVARHSASRQTVRESNSGAAPE